MRVLAVAVLAVLTAPAMAAEGMWTLDNLPKQAMQAEFGFSPDQAWVDKVMKSSVRLAGGCSGSFISPEGLVMTNHHCVVDCVAQLSSEGSDFVKNGFIAREHGDELKCPDMELNRLEQIADVTDQVRAATDGLNGDAYSKAKKAVQSRLEADCVGDDSQATRCDIVELYQGGKQHLYRYTRFQDVRLVFAPEVAAAFFGGDPDNFNFPRFNLDMGILRAYVDGKPAKLDNWFGFKQAGAAEGELVMITGHPGSTQRLLTVAQLKALRDGGLTDRLLYIAELRGLLTQYGALGEEQARQAQPDLFGIENGFKALRGRLDTLNDDAFFVRKQAEEDALRAFVAADPGLAENVGDPWAAIASAEATFDEFADAYLLIEGGRGFATEYFGIARGLYRAGAERELPNEKRLREFTEAGLPRLEQTLLSDAPLYPDYEKVKLVWSLTKLRETLGTDHPLVKRILGKESPQQLAARVIDGTRLGDVAARKALWLGGAKAVAASDDPMIALVRDIDAAARELRLRYETEVEAVEQKNAERIAQARFAKDGTGVYPDATFTLRLSYGAVQGWNEKGTDIPAMTHIAGMFERATGADPYKLPDSWLQHQADLDGSLPMNFVSTNDIIGGNSGSPVINAKAEVVGLVFDGNIHSLGGAYWYDGRLNRAVAVHPATIIEALRKIYGAGALADEMTGQ